VNACREFFDKFGDEGEKVKLLQRLEDAVAWEDLSASEYSPGPVASDEDLTRVWVNPVHYNEATRQLTPGAIIDANSHGMSCDRTRFRDVQDSLAARAEQLQRSMPNPAMVAKRVCGFSLFGVGAVRSIQFEARRAFGIYDTALSFNASHSEVCAIVAGKHAWRSVRSQLFELAKASFVER